MTLSRKFSFIILLSLVIFKQGTAQDLNCLNSIYTVKVEHPGKPFGLAKNILEIKKDKCVVEIQHEKLKILKNSWQIDVCREPVHIKEDIGAVEVLKRDGENCTENEKKKTPYCLILLKIEKLIQDDGLIFAVGEKEDLNSDHGKVYCAYSILEKYLRRGLVLSRFAEKMENLPVDFEAPPAAAPATAPAPSATPAS
ncbi:MAG: hypothetical protein U0T83_00755 [Bacteriovoracaceae bacterium]